MTNPLLAEIDAIARDTFADVGFADAATFKLTAASAAVACTVYVDRGMVDVGDESVVPNAQITVTLFRDQVAAVRFEESTVVVGAETFKIVGMDPRTDESRIVCVVRPS